MTEQDQKQLGNTLWDIADQLRGAMNADDFRDYMLSFLFLRYLSDNYEAAAQEGTGAGLSRTADRRRPTAPLARVVRRRTRDDIAEFEKQMRRKVHYVIQPDHLWSSIAELARTQNGELLHTLQKGFKYIENESFAEHLPRPVLRDQPGFGQARARTTKTATPSSAPSSRRSPRGWRSSPPTATRWAMPMNT